MVLSFETVDGILKVDISNDNHGAELSFGPFCFVLCKVVPTFESVDEILMCHYSEESYGAVIFYGVVYLFIFVFSPHEEILDDLTNLYIAMHRCSRVAVTQIVELKKNRKTIRTI